jgi:hypothetical protein
MSDFSQRLLFPDVQPPDDAVGNYQFDAPTEVMTFESFDVEFVSRRNGEGESKASGEGKEVSFNVRSARTKIENPSVQITATGMVTERTIVQCVVNQLSYRFR